MDPKDIKWRTKIKEKDKIHGPICKSESGYPGITRCTYHTKMGEVYRWRAQIYKGGKTIYLGTFKDLDDAIDVYKHAKIKLTGVVPKQVEEDVFESDWSKDWEEIFGPSK